MAAGPLNLDLYDQKIEPNRCTLIKYIETEDIVDELRQKSTISVNDYDDIHACNTRRRRAAKLLDILQTKGDNGVKEFFKTIELAYPDLYQEVTGESPRNPPPNYLKRQSRIPSLRYINHLPKLAQDLKVQYQNNKQLVQQLQELENAMVFEQNDNKELEKENSELRRKIDALRKSCDALESQVAIFMKENHNLKDDSLNYLKISIEYQKQSELYKQRAREIQEEKDEMQRTFDKNRRDHNDALRKSLPRRSQPDPSQAFSNETEHSTRETKLMLKQEILNEQLAELQQDLDHTANELIMSRMQTDEYQSLYQNVSDTCERLYKERTKMDSLLEKQLKTTNHYFEMIQKLESDKKMLEEERIKEQKKVSEESEKRNKLFMEKHTLEQSNIELLSEITRLKTEDIRKRYSKESQDSNDSQIPSGDEDNDILRKHKRKAFNISTRVGLGTIVRSYSSPDEKNTSTIADEVAITMARKFRKDEDDYNAPRKICRQRKLIDGQFVTEDVENTGEEDKSFKSDESYHTSEDNSQYPVLDDMLASYIQSSESDNASTYTIKISTPILKDKIEITGGNMTGIYVKRIIKKKIPHIQEGDKILSVGVFITDVQALHTDLVYRTFEEATHILQAQADPRHANVVEIKLQRDPKAYDRALQWIMQHGSGDLFFIRSNYNSENDSHCTNIQTGDVFCVSSTTMGTESKHWKGFRFDKETNSWSTDPVTLPNISEALKLRRGLVGGRQRGRAQAFRHRPYSRVLPTRSTSVDYSPNTETQSTPLPWNSGFDGTVHWRKENRLLLADVERYRHLLGYSSDVSFTNTSIDLDGETSSFCNSISLSINE
ncbi:caspase recruitment domain-containing protein 11-like isoform X3 [Argopecten irradians]|uniref:caspase recruitment domain-containing protein 11-like isoform X3 n=1 Tax=Argopecten irradians TaxID=31199 RepID=UPI00371422CE